MTTCVMCDEAITNPVCQACLHKGVGQWLSEREELTLAKDVRFVTLCDRDMHIDETITRCIKCNSPMQLCAYCYSKDVFDVIKSKPSLVAEFLVLFNYDLEHLGWEQDARNLIADY